MAQARVLVVEDDPTNRIMISQILKKGGFAVTSAADGRLGLDIIHEAKPDLVVSDIQMPVMDGLAMLQALRAVPATAGLPVLMLTSLHERATVRKTMGLGADDYLTKPFTPDELIASVNAQLAKRLRLEGAQQIAVAAAVTQAVDAQRHSLAGVYERRLKLELSAELWQGNNKVETNQSFDLATVLYVDLLGAPWRSLLTPSALADALKLAFGSASDALGLFGAHNVSMVGEGLVAVFVPQHDTHSMNHAARALKSAFAVIKSAGRVGAHLQTLVGEQAVGRQMPSFYQGVAIHSGPVAIAKLGETSVPVGESVNIAMQLQQRVTNSDFALVATGSALALMGNIAKTGLCAEIDLFQNGVMLPIKQVVGVVG